MDRKTQIKNLIAAYECKGLPELAIRTEVGLNALKAYMNHEPVSYKTYETIQALLIREGIYAG